MTDHPDIVERLSELADGYEEIAELDEAAAEITRLRAEAEALRRALVRITHFTSATPSLSESGCGRLLAQIEHEARAAIAATKEQQA